MERIFTQIATELKAQPRQVEAAVGLLDEGATVPFIARYRKEITGGLDDTQLRTLEERLQYLRDLEDRREVILKSIEEQDKLTDELKALIKEADTKTRLEDLYLPYRPKRRTKASVAREAGLEPLAKLILEDRDSLLETVAAEYVNEEKGVADTKAALDGARYIIMEQFAEAADLLSVLRDYLWKNGFVQSTVIEGQEQKGNKFADYFEYREALAEIPSHRALAMFRGRNEKIVNLKLIISDSPDTPVDQLNPCENKIARFFSIENTKREADTWLLDTVRKTWKTKILPHLEGEHMTRLREEAEDEAIRVFAANLKDLLMAPGAGQKSIIGLDPGLRTGVKTAVIDSTGKLVDWATIYPHQPKNQWQESIQSLLAFAAKYSVKLISIGNGTASRETDKLCADLLKQYPETRINKIVVSEAGASVYSASKFAAEEFPELDVSIRGAVSIARRLQDPLSELVKIDPKSIGVGQYQHDVNQPRLARTLGAVVEDCVNAVGVEVNTASVPLLARVSGLNEGTARKIVEFRDQNGSFSDRDTLKKVPRFGDKTFEQAAGFLKIRNGSNPLDASAVHPEAYPLVERILSDTGRKIEEIIGDKAFLKTIDARKYIDDTFGLPTVRDILIELEKPGRDPRPEFKMAEFKDDVTTLDDLEEGMSLQGVITNVTNFGAFVDIGVHHDGLVHISQLSDSFVKDPRQIVKTGDIVTVKVMSIDLGRKRVALSMKQSDVIGYKPADKNQKPVQKKKQQQKQGHGKKKKQQKKHKQQNSSQSAQPQTALALAFAKSMAKQKKQ